MSGEMVEFRSDGHNAAAYLATPARACLARVLSRAAEQKHLPRCYAFSLRRADENGGVGCRSARLAGDRAPRHANVEEVERRRPDVVSRDYARLSQRSAASAVAHSASSRAFRARKLMPTVPNAAALDDCGAPLNTSARHVISNPRNPAATTVACNSASSRAPAIQPFQRSMSRFAPSGTALVTRMSPIWRRPPGLSTRAKIGRAHV